MTDKLDRQAAFSGTREVSSQLALPIDQLTGWMQRHVEGFRGRPHLSQFKGGPSNPTDLIDADSGDESVDAIIS